MFQYILLLTFTVTIFAQNDQGQQYFLSPPLPPMAFLGQFYTAQFRVVGLDNPKFSFPNLPSFLAPQPDGTVSGTPTQLGSYPLSITFSTPQVTQSKDVVFRVVQPLPSTEYLQAKQNTTFMILYPNISLTYHTRDRILLQFEAVNGKRPYLWTFTNLPAGLLASIQGQVNGTFIHEGYYTFAVSASDNSGNTVDSYVTINVQPMSSTNNSLVEVPYQSRAFQYDLEQLESQQIEATKKVYQAINKVYQFQNRTDLLRQQAAKTAQYVSMASQQYQTSQRQMNQSVLRKQSASNNYVKRQIDQKNANNKLMLAETQVNNSQRAAEQYILFARQAQNKFQYTQSNLIKASQKFTQAQNESIEAIYIVRRVIAQSQQAYDTYNRTFISLSLAKTIAQEQVNKLTKAGFVANLAKDQVNIAESQNDNAQSNLIKMQDAYDKSISAFNSSLQLARNLTYQLQEEQKALGAAKFVEVQAKNELFVAQASKEQADKATAIASMQLATLPKNESLASRFGGCDLLSYPTMIGSELIQEVSQFGIILASGHVVLFGSCTITSGRFSAGDLVSYTGYLKNGQIHALSLGKIVF